MAFKWDICQCQWPNIQYTVLSGRIQSLEKWPLDDADAITQQCLVAFLMLCSLSDNNDGRFILKKIVKKFQWQFV